MFFDQKHYQWSKWTVFYSNWHTIAEDHWGSLQKQWKNDKWSVNLHSTIDPLVLTDLSRWIIIKEDVLRGCGGLWVSVQMLRGFSNICHSCSEMSDGGVVSEWRPQMCDAPSVFVSDSSSLFAVMKLCFHAAACGLFMCDAGCVMYVHRSHVTFTSVQQVHWVSLRSQTR